MSPFRDDNLDPSAPADIGDFLLFLAAVFVLWWIARWLSGKGKDFDREGLWVIGIFAGCLFVVGLWSGTLNLFSN